ncbi:MAG: hypothetical protein ACRD97_01440 [Nitrososphaeraceae archaeon]
MNKSDVSNLCRLEKSETDVRGNLKKNKEIDIKQELRNGNTVKILENALDY